MDMKKILQALDTASTKPVEGSNDIKKFLSVVTEGSNPHKVALPVQMAMQHYAEPVVAQPKPIKEVKYIIELRYLIHKVRENELLSLTNKKYI